MLPPKFPPHNYYAPTAYHPDRLPTQADAPPRKLFDRRAGIRLPWGDTREVLPDDIMEDPNPESMRFWEQAEKEKAEQKANGTYVPPPFAHLDLQYKHDHEVIRHAKLPFRSQFWLLMKSCGKLGVIIFTPITFLTDLAMYPVSGLSLSDYIYKTLTHIYSWLIGIPLICAIIGHIVINHFPKIWIHAPKGPLWELNRRTGMLKIFNYKHFKKTGKIEEAEAPFYEFDAYMLTTADRHGARITLSLVHRYQDLWIGVNDIIAPDNMPENPLTLWDFLQNYMDTSRPLPDIPAHEPYRHLDPVTAEHDRKTGRPPRYWIDMDNATFKAKVLEMRRRIDADAALDRPNLMARHVRYRD